MKKLLLFFVLLFHISTFAQALSGTYVIGNANTNNDFKTLTAAVAKINAVGVTGPVTFLLDENFTTPLGQPITFTNFSGSSTINTLTIKPNIGKNVTITASNANGYSAVQAVFKFDGADNIIIDGSNTVGGTSRDLLLNNSDYVNYAFRTVIWVASNASKGANNIKILNTKLEMAVRNQGGLLAGVFSGSNVVGANNSVAGQVATAANSNLTFSNNEFLNVRQAIVINSDFTEALKSSNILISNNKIGSTIELKKPLIAFDIINTKNFNILDNTIDGMGRASVGGDGYLTGIRINTSSNFTIKRNIIKNLTFNSNSITGYGIHIIGLTTDAVISENRVTTIKNLDNALIRGLDLDVTAESTGIVLANNFISDISSTQVNDFTDSVYGIFIANGIGTKVYHNTVALNAVAGGLSAAIRIQGGTGFDFRNNIFTNTSGTGSKRFAIYSNVNAAAFTTINNNNYFAPIIGFRGSERINLADWKMGISSGTGNTGKDQNSISVNPTFVSTTDLHLQSVPGNVALDNKGTALPAITTDIDGQTRNITTPDMGADEFSAVPAVPQITASVTSLPAFTSCNQTTSASQSFTISGNNLTANIVLTAPTGFELSKDDTTFSNSITYTQISGSIANSVVYARMKPTSTAVSGSIAITSTNAATKNISVSGAVGATTTWDGTAWSAGVPTSTMTAIINGAYSEAVFINACSLTIKSGAIATIPAAYDVTLNGALIVESGASFTMASNTNLIQNTDIQNSGIVTIERESSKLYRLDYTMWGSPLNGAQTLKQFSPNTLSNRFYTYNTGTDLFNLITPETNTFAPGAGYLIRMANNHTIFGNGVAATSWTGSFSGTPTNGTISVTLSSSGQRFNMIANPYPSMINAKTFLNDNKYAIEGTLYFWRRRNNLPFATEGTTAYYATYTAAGGTSVSKSERNGVIFTSEKANGFIQVGQGFLVQKLATDTTGNISFTNSMRSAINNDNQFFRNASTEETSRIWLNVSSNIGEFGQTLIAYLPEAENGLDRTDGKYLNDGSTALTSWLDNAEYIIQGRYPFTVSDVVALNFKTLTAGSYNISIDHVDGLFEGDQDIYLRDKAVGIIHNLKTSAYTFTTTAGSFNSRFELVYENGTLVVDNPAFDSSSVVLYKKDGDLTVKSKGTILQQVEVFDFAGRLLATAKNIKANEVSMKINDVNQVLIVKITSTDGRIISKKIIN